MAVTQIGIAKEFNKLEFQGLSTDTKPTTFQSQPLGNGSTFVELDTGKFWLYDKNNLGATQGWWNVCLLKTL